MTLDQCKAAACKLRAQIEADVSPSLWMSSTTMKQTADAAGIVLPSVWLELLDDLFETLWFQKLGSEKEVNCNLSSPEQLHIRWTSQGGPLESPEMVGGRVKCVEFGSDDFGSTFVFDLENRAMPQDASVLYIDHETLDIVREWDSVLDFVWESLNR